jgi:hypothetical protein
VGEIGRGVKRVGFEFKGKSLEKEIENKRFEIIK